jgi:hypothetical protein
MPPGFARLFLHLAIAISSVAVGCAPLSGNPLPEKLPPSTELIGEWTGKAKVIVSSVSRDSITVFLKILPRGDIMGRVGDAPIRRAYVAKNDGWVGRFFNTSTDFVVVGNLAGPIIAGSDARPDMTIPFMLRNGTIRGEIQAGNREVERSKAVSFSATNMCLRKTRDYNSERP